MYSLPSGVRLVRLLKRAFEWYHELRAYEYRLYPLVLHRSLLGGIWVLGLSVAPCVPGQRGLRRCACSATRFQWWWSPWRIVRSARMPASTSCEEMTRITSNWLYQTLPHGLPRVARRRGGGVTFIELESMSGKVAQTSYYRYFWESTISTKRQ